MSDQNFSAIRARLRYETIEDFVDGYARFISAGGMFIPMKPGKLKPIGTTIRFQFLLGDGSTALLGEGVVLQVRAPDDASPQSPVGMLIKFSKLAQESKALVDRIVDEKATASVTEDADIHNDRTPLPQDQESYERKTRESFDSPAAKAAREFAAESSDVHSKTTDAGTDRGNWQETTREQPAVTFLDDTIIEGGSPVNDVYESDEEANDAVVAAALAMASEVSEVEQELVAEASDADDEISLEEIDPETAESPETAEPETREAPEMIEAIVQETRSPTQLGETAGGLKILAFDEDMDAAAMQALEEFSFGAEEADIDDMFDGLFGGDSGGGGGFFGPDSEPEAQPSMELEVSGLTEEVSDELVEEEVLVAEEEAVELADEVNHEERPVFSLEDLMDDDEPALNVSSEVEERAPQEAPVAFSLEDILDESVESEPAKVIVSDVVDEPVGGDEDDEDDDDAFSLSDIVEDEPGELDGMSDPELSLDDALEESEPELGAAESDGFESPPFDEPAFEAPAFETAESRDAPEDIGSLLDSLDDRSRMTPESMHLGTSPREESAADEESAVQDEESLEALLASARREMEEKSTEEPRDSGDILDQLLGPDLPPPPAEGPVFGMPQPEKKKGFFSKLFDKG